MKPWKQLRHKNIYAMKIAKLPSQSKEERGQVDSSVHLCIWEIGEGTLPQEVKNKMSPH